MTAVPTARMPNTVHTQLTNFHAYDVGLPEVLLLFFMYPYTPHPTAHIANQSKFHDGLPVSVQSANIITPMAAVCTPQTIIGVPALRSTSRRPCSMALLIISRLRSAVIISLSSMILSFVL